MKLYAKFEPYNYWVIFFIWNFLFTHNGVYFHVLGASAGLRLAAFFCYIPVIFMIACIVVFTVLSKNSKGKRKEPKEEVTKKV